MSASYGRSGHGLSGCSTGHVGPMSTIPLMPEAPAVGVSLGTVVSVAGTVVELASGARVAVPALRARGFDCWTPAPSLAEAEDRAAATIRLVGLAGREHVEARFLSYGQRRLLEIGVALAGEPELLLLDEPTSGLGSRPMETLRTLVQRLAAELTIVVIEHDMDFVLSLSHHVAVLHRGTVIAEGPPEAIRDDAEVREAYLGRLAVARRR